MKHNPVTFMVCIALHQFISVLVSAFKYKCLFILGQRSEVLITKKQIQFSCYASNNMLRT